MAYGQQQGHHTTGRSAPPQHTSSIPPEDFPSRLLYPSLHHQGPAQGLPNPGATILDDNEKEFPLELDRDLEDAMPRIETSFLESPVLAGNATAS